MIEQGLTLTVIERPAPFEGADLSDVYAARRLWLGSVPGVEWLHESLEEAVLASGVVFEVRSERRSLHGGASGEIAVVVLTLMGIGALSAGKAFADAFFGKLGEGAADALLGAVRERAHERRRATGHEIGDPPPDFFTHDWEGRGHGMARELADVLAVPESRLELVRAERREALAMYAIYRDSQTGHEYTVELSRDAVEAVDVV